MLASTSLFTVFTALAVALPTSNHVVRAGGPAITPIPENCVISDPKYTTTEPFLPTSASTDALLYSAYYPSNSDNTTQMSEQCLQQCYGYGSHVECKAAYWAENVKTPAGYYGTPGGELMTACLLYTRTMLFADFETAPEGQGTGAYTRNLACPVATSSDSAERR
jgi:hypothetical protein